MLRSSAALEARAPRRFAAVAVLAHVLTFVAAAALGGQPVVKDGQAGVEHSLVEGGLWPVYGGMYLLALGFLALLGAMTFLTGALGHRTPGGAWAARTARLAGLGSVLVVVGVGFSAGAAGLWALHHGADLETVLAVNNVRNFSYFVATPWMGLYAATLGFAALSDGVFRRWVGWGGIAVGVALLLAVPLAAVGVQFAQPLWLLWWVGVAVSLWRYTPLSRSDVPEAATAGVVVGHD